MINKISVIIPTYNRSTLLDYTLKSIVNQTVEKSIIEVIVVDDGSTDTTFDIVQKYKSHLVLKYLYQEDKGYRVASARNLAIENATGQLLIFVDSGVFLSSDSIQQHLNTHLKSTYNIAVIGYVLGIEEEYDPNEVLLKQVNCNNPDETIVDFLSQRKYLDIREKVYNSCNDHLMKLPAPWALCWTGNMSVKKTMVDKVGPFDTAFDGRWGMEDLEFSYRLFKENIIFILQRKASSIHCPHYSNTTKKLEEEIENKSYFLNKHQMVDPVIFMSCTGISLNEALLATL